MRIPDALDTMIGLSCTRCLPDEDWPASRLDVCADCDECGRPAIWLLAVPFTRRKSAPVTRQIQALNSLRSAA